MYDRVELSNGGLEGFDYDFPDGDETVEKDPNVAIISGWRSQIVVKEGTTLKGIIGLFLKMSNTTWDTVGNLTNSSFQAYMLDLIKNHWKDWDALVSPDSEGLTSIEVYKLFEMDNYETCSTLYDIKSSVSAHGIGETWQDADTQKLSEEEKKKYNHYAIEFMAWPKLIGLPVKVAEKATLGKTTWKRVPPRERFMDTTTGKKFSMGLTTHEVESMENTEVTSDMTVGEFFTGLFNEICFFSTPDHRDEKMDELHERIKEVEVDVKKLQN